MRLRFTPVAVMTLGLWVLITGPTGAARDRDEATAMATAGASGTAVYNVTIATDATPDLTDLPRFIDSATSPWSTPEEKVWALFYWTHILKRQTPPMVLHGFEVTDPIRNFNDYGFTMCSTISGINQTLFEMLGLQHQFWDICSHTVSQVYYDGQFHLIDSSLSNLVTTTDGSTLASLQQASVNGARLLKEHSLYATSANGFLTGSDSARSLTGATNPFTGAVVPGVDDAFCENGLLLRDYYYNWNRGHRYILNLHEGESYTRHYAPLGTTTDYYVSSERAGNPDPANTYQIDAANRFGLRGNGHWSFTPHLNSNWATSVYTASNVTTTGFGVTPAGAGSLGEAVYSVQAANAITSQQIDAEFTRSDPAATAVIAISVHAGVSWSDVGALPGGTGTALPLTVRLRDQVNGRYDTLVRVRLSSAVPDGIVLTRLAIDTFTQVNAKALPRLNIGRNEIVVGASEQTESIVLWPDLRGTLWQRDAADSSNVATQAVTLPRDYTAVLFPADITKDAYITYRMAAPGDITQVTYGGRLHNYFPGSYIDFLHSFDNGATWIHSYRFADVSLPYDDIHYETVADIPPGTRAVLFKYVMHNRSPEAWRATGLYSVRMEADYQGIGAQAPLDVTFRWREVAADRSTVARSHKQRIDTLPARYVINVAGQDHPVMESMTVSLSSAGDGAGYGYGNGVDPGGAKYAYRKRVDGTNLAAGRPYTASRLPSGFKYSAAAANTTVLTDGVVGAPATGGSNYWWGQCWTAGPDVDLQIDLGSAQAVGAFRAHLFGYPGWDALKGEVQDRVEVFTSTDGAAWVSRGLLETSVWKKDIPINYMLQDDETATAWNFELIPPSSVQARYVRYRATPRRDLCISELQVLDRVTYQPFDMRIALPSGGVPTNQPPAVSLTSPAAGATFVAPATVGIDASASDSDGSVARVEFYANGILVGADASAPYAASWTGVSSGTYTLTAQAIDNTGAASVSAPVTITVSDPPLGLWSHQDVGAVNRAGAAVTDGTVWTVSGAGADVWGTADAFHFLSQPLAGDGEIVARVTAVQNVHEWTKAGVMMREALTAASAHAFMFVTPSGSKGLAFQRRVTTGGMSTHTSAGAGVPPAWVRLTRRGAVIQAFRSADGVNWTLSGSDTIAMAPTIWVGLAVTSHDTSALASASFDHVLVTHGPPANQPPTVTVTSPATGAAFVAPAVVPITASASDEDGTIARVEFYADGTLLGTDSSAPYSVSWGIAAAGTYAVTAKAVDDGGAAVTSAPVTVTVTAPAVPTWSHQDVGTVTQPGSATGGGGAWAVSGAGADVWGTADAFHFVSQPLEGDGEIVARVAAVESVNEWTKAGVMMREALTADSTHAFMFVTPAGTKGLAFQRRVTTGGMSTHTSAGSGLPPAWVRLTRRGNTVEAFRSADGATWTLVGSDIIAMAPTIWVGLAVTSHDSGRVATATFDQVLITQGTPLNQPPTVTVTGPAAGAAFVAPAAIPITAAASDGDGTVARVEFHADGTLVGSDTTAPYSALWSGVPAGVYGLTATAIDNRGAATTSAPVMITVSPPAVPTWSHQDIGTGMVAGAAIGSDTTWTVTGSGADVWGTADAFHFVSQPLAGDGEIVARVASVQDVDEWTKAGIMMRESLTADSVHAFMFVTPAGTKGLAFQRRATVGGTSRHTAAGSGVPPAWLRLTRHGATIEAFRSADGATWTLVGSDTIDMAPMIWVGLAVTSHDPNRLATATFDHVAVTAGTPLFGPARNQPPVVALTAPSDGAIVAAQTAVVITADAHDADGYLTSVSILVDGVPVATERGSPSATTTWQATRPGSFVITARATDDRGISSESAPATLLVTNDDAGEDVVLYAADASVVSNWIAVSDATAADGRRLKNRTADATPVVTASILPASYFEMTFVAEAGRPYRLWLRGQATEDSATDDSVHVQFEDSVTATGQPTDRIGTTTGIVIRFTACSECDASGWGWQGHRSEAAGMNGPVVYFGHNGVQRIRIQMGQGDVDIDQVVLSSVRWLRAAPGRANRDTTILPKRD